MCEIDYTNTLNSINKFYFTFINFIFNYLNYFINNFYIDVYQCDVWNKFLSLCCELHRRFIILSLKVISLDCVLLCINNL